MHSHWASCLLAEPCPNVCPCTKDECTRERGHIWAFPIRIHENKGTRAACTARPSPMRCGQTKGAASHAYGRHACKAALTTPALFPRQRRSGATTALQSSLATQTTVAFSMRKRPRPRPPAALVKSDQQLVCWHFCKSKGTPSTGLVRTWHPSFRLRQIVKQQPPQPRPPEAP